MVVPYAVAWVGVDTLRWLLHDACTICRVDCAAGLRQVNATASLDMAPVLVVVSERCGKHAAHLNISSNACVREWHVLRWQACNTCWRCMHPAVPVPGSATNKTGLTHLDASWPFQLLYSQKLHGFLTLSAPPLLLMGMPKGADFRLWMIPFS